MCTVFSYTYIYIDVYIHRKICTHICTMDTLKAMKRSICQIWEYSHLWKLTSGMSGLLKIPWTLGREGVTKILLVSLKMRRDKCFWYLPRVFIWGWSVRKATKAATPKLPGDGFVVVSFIWSGERQHSNGLVRFLSWQKFWKVLQWIRQVVDPRLLEALKQTQGDNRVRRLSGISKGLP